jgi:hypothetical protein
MLTDSIIGSILNLTGNQKIMNLSSKYSNLLNTQRSSVLNYLSSHDDGAPLMDFETMVLKQEQNYYFHLALHKFFL